MYEILFYIFGLVIWAACIGLGYIITSVPLLICSTALFGFYLVLLIQTIGSYYGKDDDKDEE